MVKAKITRCPNKPLPHPGFGSSWAEVMATQERLGVTVRRRAPEAFFLRNSPMGDPEHKGIHGKPRIRGQST
jgi:hypothetical protein